MNSVNRLVAFAAIRMVYATWRNTEPWSEYLRGSVAQSVIFAAGVTLVRILFNVINASVRKALHRPASTLIGGGDLKLLFVLSLFLPFWGYTLMLFTSCVLVAVIEPLKRLVNRSRQAHFAFGPYIFVACVVIGSLGIFTSMQGQ